MCPLRILSHTTLCSACLATLVLCVSCSDRRSDLPHDDATLFMNPILPAPSADPWLVQHGGMYVLSESRNRSIVLRRAERITALADDPGTVVWSAPASGPYSQEIWAPELHRFGDRWYIYFAADDGKNAHHRMWVIVSTGDDPYGPYGACRELTTDGWAIDGTVLSEPDGKLYFIWSGWPDSVDGFQQLYIASMDDPLTVSGKRQLLVSPTEPWERRAMPICEGPEVLQRNGRTLLVYSASGSWTKEYCLGMLINTDGNVLSPSSWRKTGPVFSGTHDVHGVGHCSFVRSPDGTEDWIVYHAKEKEADGWEDRSVRIQRFTWNSDGYPVFGPPVAAGIPLAIPSEHGK